MLCNNTDNRDPTEVVKLLPCKRVKVFVRFIYLNDIKNDGSKAKISIKTITVTHRKKKRRLNEHKFYIIIEILFKGREREKKKTSTKHTCLN